MPSTSLSSGDNRFELLRLAAFFAARGHNIWIKAPADELRKAWLDCFSQAYSATQSLSSSNHTIESKRIIQVPAHCDRDALFGGIDLHSSLATGTQVKRAGLVGQGPLVIQMAERWDRALTAELALVLDQIDSNSSSVDALIVLDESFEDDIPVSLSLTDRCTLIINLHHQPLSTIAKFFDADPILLEPHGKLANTSEDNFLSSLDMRLAETSLMLGISSLRHCVQARALIHDACQFMSPEQAFNLALNLSLVPRATQLPQSHSAQEEDLQDQTEEVKERQEALEPANNSENVQETNESTQLENLTEELAEVILQAAVSSLPPDILNALTRKEKTKQGRQGASGQLLKNSARGRIIGSSRRPQGRSRPELLPSLFAALPWQNLRRKTKPRANTQTQVPALIIEKGDFRFAKRQTKTESVLIFAVDASGSAAATRLSETKGAIEILLAQSYARRDHVALIAFRGKDSQTVLPPTRSLARAKRSLAQLPGGGATPVAAGIDSCAILCKQIRQTGRTPFVIFMSDGKANITREGLAGRAQAHSEALQAATVLSQQQVTTLFMIRQLINCKQG